MVFYQSDKIIFNYYYRSAKNKAKDKDLMFSFSAGLMVTVQDGNVETNEAAQSYGSPWLSGLSYIFIKHISELVNC